MTGEPGKPYPCIRWKGVFIICMPIGTVIKETAHLPWTQPREFTLDADSLVFKDGDVYCTEKGFNLLKAKIEGRPQ